MEPAPAGTREGGGAGSSALLPRRYSPWFFLSCFAFVCVSGPDAAAAQPQRRSYGLAVTRFLALPACPRVYHKPADLLEVNWLIDSK